MAPDGDVSRGIDGWRLDVPSEIPMPFWVEWCSLVKSINPEAYITGEIWHDAQEWLDGTTFDAVMNYPFAEAAVAWIGDKENRLSTSQFAARLESQRQTYPTAAVPVLQNLLDSHDTDRIASKFANPDRNYETGGREQEDDTYDASKPSETCYRKARLAALLQMTSLGAPMIYYGDEVGMWGSDDPNNRKPMLWADLEAIDADHLAFYTEVIALRNNHLALRRGDVRILETRDDPPVLLFERVLGEERLLVALNASLEAAPVSLPNNSVWTLCFGSFEDAHVPPLSGSVWKATS
jgi:glycosidase